MRTLITVMIKELTETFRDRKIIINGLLMVPLLVPVLILGMGALAQSRAEIQLESWKNWALPMKPAWFPPIERQNACSIMQSRQRDAAYA
jgi:ABC-type transport system involved in cytochrome c biogenesis permease component